ncbi:MAG: hypothetical protein GY796_27915 [Chloroflexi bacterium]|nr:hypothetical protein [Chloroflexota bacterium]
MEKITYHDWPNCYRLTNSIISLILTTDVGPRIIHFGFTGSENEFATVPDDLGKMEGDEWRLFGGHRLWHAPESQLRTYYPDFAPVAIEEHERFVRLIQPTEATTGIQKELDITLDGDAAHVTVTHRLRNQNMWTVELAPWALSVMVPGGTAVLPLPPRKLHNSESLQPTSQLSIWSYTDMSDPRWVWGQKYILLHQEPGNTISQKIGAMALDGWAGYVRDSRLFIKTFPVHPHATYPDRNANVEFFTCDFMLEVETLGPLTALPPGGEVTHTEQWYLFNDVPALTNDADVDKQILPRLADIL